MFSSLCVVCLRRYQQMFCLKQSFKEALDSLEDTSTNQEENIIISQALYKVLQCKESTNEEYPQNICSMCLGILKVAYDFKVLFEESQEVIFKCLNDSNALMETPIEENMKNQSNVPVEIIIGTNKYDLKDLVIVESGHDTNLEEFNYSGFLKNLGTNISATFSGSRSGICKNISPVLEIIKKDKPCFKNKSVITEDLKKEICGLYKDHKIDRNNVNCFNLDQYIIIGNNDSKDTILHIINEDENNSETMTDYDTHDVLGRYECSECKSMFVSSDEYYSHINNCDKPKGPEENLEDIERVLIQSAKNLRYECNICNKIYSSKTRYDRHSELCGKMYKIIKNTEGEAQLIPLFQCEYCSMTFKELKFLNYHVKHHKMPSFTCDICNEKFKTRSSRNYHKLTQHSESKYVCQFCGKKFRTSTTLNVHIQVHNRTKTQCICPVCGKTFHYKGGLFYHMKQHTNERKYKCEYCGKCFYTITAKKRHDLTHTGVRPCQCKYCDKRFFSKGELTKHEYIHTGVLPYKCKYCNKGFTSGFNMKVHWFNHTGSFDCKHCFRGFITKEVLQFHCRIKHKTLLEEQENAELI